MSISWLVHGGIEGGGQGDFASARKDPCRLIVTEAGLMNSLNLLRAKWDTRWLVGLYQSDTKPRLNTTMASLTVCDFSGYGGELKSFGWTPAAMSGERAISRANPLIWAHDGGPTANWVYGYYVVDPAGVLQWAERFCPTPLTVDKAGISVRIIPTFYLLNEYPD